VRGKLEHMEATSSRSLAYIALFAAFVAVLGLVPKIDLPLGVPITTQTLGVMLAGCLLGPLRSFLAMLLFLAGVALGLPLLAGGRGGIGVFAAPSAGFVLGWPLGAAVAGVAMRGLPGPVWLRAFAASTLGGIGMVYLCGIVGLALATHMAVRHAAIASLIFVPGDFVKATLSAVIVRTVARGLPGGQLSRG
jgi:biotin transport system substrate-specific component